MKLPSPWLKWTQMPSASPHSSTRSTQPSLFMSAQRGEEPLMQLLPPASPPRNEIVSAPGGRYSPANTLSLHDLISEKSPVPSFVKSEMVRLP